MRNQIMFRAVSILALSAALFGAPLAADILILEDGSSIETKGAWEVRGAVIVFTLPSGALSSIRASKVDLDASAVATVRASEEPAEEPEPAPPVEPVLVLTDSDVSHVSRAEIEALRAAAAGEEDLAEPADDEPETAFDEPTDDGMTIDDPETAETSSQAPTVDPDVERLQISQWEESSLSTGLAGTRITGVLANSSREIVTQIRVSVLLMDEAGRLIASDEAIVANGALRPEQDTTFRAEFPGVIGFDSVKFETQHVALAWRATEE